MSKPKTIAKRDCLRCGTPIDATCGRRRCGPCAEETQREHSAKASAKITARVREAREARLADKACLGCGKPMASEHVNAERCIPCRKLRKANEWRRVHGLDPKPPERSGERFCEGCREWGPSRLFRQGYSMFCCVCQADERRHEAEYLREVRRA